MSLKLGNNTEMILSQRKNSKKHLSLKIAVFFLMRLYLKINIFF